MEGGKQGLQMHHESDLSRGLQVLSLLRSGTGGGNEGAPVGTRCATVRTDAATGFKMNLPKPAVRILAPSLPV